MRTTTILQYFSLLILGILLSSLVFTSCQEYVYGVAPANYNGSPSDYDLYSDEGTGLAIPALSGFLGRYQRTLAIYQGVLSDECVSARGISRDAIPKDVQDYDAGNPSLPSTNDSWQNLHEMYKVARLMIARAPLIAFKQDSSRRRYFYLGWFFQGYADHQQAAFFGLNPREGGGIISGSPFIPSAQLHDSAFRKFSLALSFARTPFERRLANSFLARITLLEEKYQEALTYAKNGLQQGDASFSIIYFETIPNSWPFLSGRIGESVLPDKRFVDYLRNDSAEQGRIPLLQGTKPDAQRTEPYFLQDKYPAVNSPLEIMTWQENSLMIAEAELRVSNNSAAALVEVNRVRSSVTTTLASRGAVSLAPRTQTNLDSVYVEREKQLFGTGMHLADQRRFNRWHLPAGTWQYLPIPQKERDANPNLKK